MSDEGKLYVGNLKYATSRDSLGEAFRKYGAIKVCTVIIDRDTQNSRGFGFVTFENPEDAKKAIDRMNGTELEGRQISVRKVLDKTHGNQGRGGGREYGGDYRGEYGREYGGERGRGRGGGRGGYYRQPYQTNE